MEYVKFACKCLNIELTALKSSMTTVDRSLYEEGKLFEEELMSIEIIHVIKRLQSLVEEVESASWYTYRCMNCCLWVHASAKQIGVNKALVNKQLLSDISSIEKLRKSDMYSPVFKIIIKNTNFKESAIDIESQDNLDPIAINWLKEQSLQSEERIKDYCDKEHSNLEQLKMRVHKDQMAINRLLSEVNANKNTNSKGTSEGKREIARSASIKGRRRSNRSSSPYDSERIFDFEEFDDSLSKGNSEETNSDDSDREEIDVPLPRRFGNSNEIARSLPIPVPQFVEDRKGENRRSPAGAAESSARAPYDIAASIKALAKSVHGDPIFGELPRPRFPSNY